MDCLEQEVCVKDWRKEGFLRHKLPWFRGVEAVREGEGQFYSDLFNFFSGSTFTPDSLAI